MFYCYILQSLKSSKYYIGTSGNLEERLKFHNAGKVKSTKGDRPWKIVYYEKFTTLREARKRELQIKRWKSRKAIERLIKTFEI
ncbi:MAG: GIY-YIG nuclease family protein [Patescibacteria group bacterium]|nr:GIY-YIG nuclease family protein [Patescibacteria group bacterium]